MKNFKLNFHWHLLFTCRAMLFSVCPSENLALHVSCLPWSLAADVNVSVETVRHRACPDTWAVVVEAGMLAKFHVRVGVCWGQVCEAVQVIVVATPSRNSVDEGLMINGKKEPKI